MNSASSRLQECFLYLWTTFAPVCVLSLLSLTIKATVLYTCMHTLTHVYDSDKHQERKKQKLKCHDVVIALQNISNRADTVHFLLILYVPYVL